MKSIVKREAISPEERLCVTLRYVVTGDAGVTITASYRISATSISRIIKETTKVIWNVFQDKGFLKSPISAQKWEEIAQSFEKKRNFQHCLATIDGKHIIMQAPAKNGSLFYNYKKSFSGILLAVCNADYEFTLIDIGEPGRQSDGGVFPNSNLGYAIVNDLLDFSEPENVNDSDFKLPFVFVGDDAFPLKTNLVKPYSAFHLYLEKPVTNYRMSRAKRIIENTFAILATRFHIFRRPIVASVETVESVSKCCIALHNYLMADRLTDKENAYCPINFVDQEVRSKRKNGEWRLVVENDCGLVLIPKLGSNNYSKDAKIVRDSFC